MKKTLSIILTSLVLSCPVFAENLIAQEVETLVTQEIKNDNTYLGANLAKTTSDANGKQLITNHKSFLILNIIINDKYKEKK